jgi:hypothetical protein
VQGLTVQVAVVIDFIQLVVTIALLLELELLGREMMVERQ